MNKHLLLASIGCLTFIILSTTSFAACGSTNGVTPTSVAPNSTNECSINNSGIYYTFNLASDQDVTINLNNSSGSSTFYLYEGSDALGSPIYVNQTSLSQNLSAGDWTVEVINWETSNQFTLSLTASGDTTEPEPEPILTNPEISDNFAAMAGQFPQLLSDNDDSTYVQGGLLAPNNDYTSKFTLQVGQHNSLTFNETLQCLSGSCGDHTGCAVYHKLLNRSNSQYEDIGSHWSEIGTFDQEITVEDASPYINSNGEVELYFSWECNMNGKILEFALSDTEEEIIEETEEIYGTKKCETAECEEAQACALALTPTEGCMMELVDLIPYVDKSAAASLLYDDICSMKERFETGDPIGIGVTGLLMIIDLADNALDFIPLVGNIASTMVDAVEGTIDCVESIIYEYYFKDCGGYLWCALDLIQAVADETTSLGRQGISFATSLVHSPVTISATDNSGEKLTGLDGAIKFNFENFKALLIPNPEKFEQGYNIEIDGTGDGSYTLETTITDSNGEIKKEFTKQDIPISSSDTNYYHLSVPDTSSNTNITFEETDIYTPKTFTDLPSSHWSYNYVKALTKQNIISGYSDGTFRPDQAITRAELLKITLEAFNKDATAFENLYFDDFTMNDWFAKYVVYAAENDFVSGYSDGTFRPNQAITRAEALKIVIQIADKTDELNTLFNISVYKDVSDDDWHAKYFSYALKMNIVNGYDDYTLKPNQSITRAEATKIIMETKSL